MKIFRKYSTPTFTDNVFFSIPNQEPFSLDIAIIMEYLSLYKLTHNSKKLGLLILLENPDVRSFVDIILTRFENYKIIKKHSDRKYTKGENYHLAYELGGYTEYMAFRKRELNFPKFQRKVNFWLITAAIIGAISPILTTYINNQTSKAPILKVPPTPPSPQVVVRFDSLSLIELKHLIEKDKETNQQRLRQPRK